MSTTITAAVIVMVAGSMIFTVGQLVASKQLRHNYVLTLRAARWWMVPAGFANVSVVLLVVLGITRLAPWSWVGWWKLLSGTASNVWLGQTGQTGLWWQIAAISIPLGVLLILPMMAYGEEVIFRQGSEKRSIPARVGSQVLFGFVHCALAGVPLAAGLALTASGFYFERIYLTERRLLEPEIEVAKHIPKFAPTPYPSRPSGPGYDAAAWDRHRQECETVSESNRHLLDEWLQGLPARAEEAARRVQVLEERAVAKAAAAHAVSNALLIGTLLVSLLSRFPQ